MKTKESQERIAQNQRKKKTDENPYEGVDLLKWIGPVTLQPLADLDSCLI